MLPQLKPDPYYVNESGLVSQGLIILTLSCVVSHYAVNPEGVHNQLSCLVTKQPSDAANMEVCVHLGLIRC